MYDQYDHVWNTLIFYVSLYIGGNVSLCFFSSFSNRSLNKPSGYQCSNDEFVCDNGQCVASSLRCDGDMACQDNSDEQNCACLSDEFNCGSGTCVDVTKLCDGIKDCPEGSDETNCGKES